MENLSIFHQRILTNYTTQSWISSRLMANLPIIPLREFFSLAVSGIVMKLICYSYEILISLYVILKL